MIENKKFKTRKPLKRTPFKQKIPKQLVQLEDDQEISKPFKPIKRKSWFAKPKSLKQSNLVNKPVKDLKSVRRTSKKVQEWSKVRAELKERFYAADITFCEAGFDGCLKNNYLAFAHTKKRRNIDRNAVEGDELYLVALLCVKCHEFLEFQGEDKMEPAILEIINNRKVKL